MKSLRNFIEFAICFDFKQITNSVSIITKKKIGKGARGFLSQIL